jgi:hypothetical protein
MTLNKLAFSLLGALALTAPAFAGTSAPASSGKCSKCVAPQVAPAEELLGFTLGVGYDTNYFFRGLEFGENWVTSSLDYTTGIADGVRLDLGANYGHLADSGISTSNGPSYDRLELGAAVVADLGGAELGLGYTYYHHMGDFGNVLALVDSGLEDGHEVNLNLASKLGIFNVGIGGNYDFAIDGWYLEAAVNTEIVINDWVSLVPGANIGYGIDYTWHLQGVTGVSDFTHVGVSLSLPIKLSKTATLTPYVAGNLPLDGLEGSDNQLFGGVSLSVKF